MNQIIFLNSYVGLSDFTFEVTCSGHQLTHQEVVEKGLFTADMQRRHKQSSHVYEWYTVNPGDTFTITHISDDVRRRTMFRVPVRGMNNPNASVDNWDATGLKLEKHLTDQCELISQEEL